MGCSQSNNEATDPIPNNPNSALTKSALSSSTLAGSPNSYPIIMLGNTAVHAVVLAFSGKSFDPLPCRIPIPRYCHALLQDTNTGFITGGIEDLQANINQKATIEMQILEGTISKKFIKVDIRKLLIDPATSFDVLPDMINARYAHAATQMNGSIYVVGGRQYGTDENGLLSACEKYQPSNKRWKALPSMQYPRAASGLIVYGEHLYVFGGYSGNNTRTRAIETYSDGDSSWRRLPFQLHQGFEGALIIKKPNSEGSVLILGGRTNSGRSNRVSEMNFDRSTVSYFAPMHEQRCFHKGRAVGSEIFVVGGGTEYFQTYTVPTQQAELHRELSYLQYCTVKELNSFSQFQEPLKLSYMKKHADPPLPENRVCVFGHAFEPFAKIINTDNLVVASEGQSLHHSFYQFTTVIRVNKQNCFVLGGIWPDLSEVTNTAYSYNLLNSEIKPLEPMITPRYAFGASVLGSYLYVAGGRKLGDDDVAILNQCERFSFESYKWESIASLRHKRQSTTLIAYSDYVIALGGYKGNETRANQIEIYVPAQNRWIELDFKFELAVEAMTPVYYQNVIYLFGGRSDMDIQKIFKLNIDFDSGVKFEKSLRAELEPVGHLSNPGTNLKVCVNPNGIAVIFGNIPAGVDIYDMNKHKIVQTQQLAVFQRLSDPLFQSYTLIY